jgi:hypothetical protein
MVNVAWVGSDGNDKQLRSYSYDIYRLKNMFA